MKLFFWSAFLWIFLGIFPSQNASATFYGEIPSGYSYETKGAHGYGVYVPKSFNPNKRNGLIFAFGRSSRDLALEPKNLESYSMIWRQAAENSGYVVVIPYWQPVIIGSGQHTESFFLEILEMVKKTYNVPSSKVLLVGSGLGARFAFALAAFYPEKFESLAAIGLTPFGDHILDALMKERLIAGLPPKNIPATLLVYSGQQAKAWMKKSAAVLRDRGTYVELMGIPSSQDARDTNIKIIDWFEG